MNRKKALERLDGLAPRIEEHLAKIADEPDSQDAPHWIHEVNSWIEQLEHLLPHIGKRTAVAWGLRITKWKDRLKAEHGP